MTAQRGDKVRLWIGDGGTPESFSVIGGARLTALEIQNMPLENTNVATGAWRSQLTASGLRQVMIQCEGMFTDSAAEAAVRSAAFSGMSAQYKVSFGNGDEVSGAFIITRFDKYGEQRSEELYTLQLKSAGMVSYSAGA